MLKNDNKTPPQTKITTPPAKTTAPPKDAVVPKDALTPESIRTWALANKPRAKALGLRLAQNNGLPAEEARRKMKDLPSLGEMEDRVTSWAIENPEAARKLFLSLLPLVMLG